MVNTNAEKIDIETCYKKYAPMIFRRCMGILRNEDDALDACQDVFFKLIKGQMHLHGQFLSSLLYVIATNTCLNRLRQRKKHENITEDPENLFPGVNDREFEKIEAGILLNKILTDESESTRTICFMYYRDNMSLNEIGKLMDLSVSGVRKRLIAFKTRALQKCEGEQL